MQISIHEQPLPGIGRRYDLALDRGRRLSIVVRRGGRDLAVFVEDTDEPAANVTLTEDQALAVAAVLTGARFSVAVEPEAPTRPPLSAQDDRVVVEAVTLGDGAPIVGKRLDEIVLPHPDAAVLGIVRDDTPELLEDLRQRRCRPGDRVIVAARPAAVREIATLLGGGLPGDTATASTR